MNDWIAERELELLMDDGTAGIVRLTVYKPYRIDKPGGPMYSCRITIDHPGRPRDREIHGVDSLQALILAIRYLEINTKQLQLSSGGRLLFDGDEDVWVGLDGV